MLGAHLATSLQIIALFVPAGLHYAGACYTDNKNIFPLELLFAEQHIERARIARLDHDGSGFVFSVEKILHQVMGAGLVEDEFFDVLRLIDKERPSRQPVASPFVADDA